MDVHWKCYCSVYLHITRFVCDNFTHYQWKNMLKYYTNKSIHTKPFIYSITASATKRYRLSKHFICFVIELLAHFSFYCVAHTIWMPIFMFYSQYNTAIWSACCISVYTHGLYTWFAWFICQFFITCRLESGPSDNLFAS